MRGDLVNSTTLTPAEIRDLLSDKGFRVVHIAEALEMTPSSIYAVINGKNHSPRIAKAIASCLALPVEKIFGGKYSDNKREEVIHTIRNAFAAQEISK